MKVLWNYLEDVGRGGSAPWLLNQWTMGQPPAPPPHPGPLPFSLSPLELGDGF